MKNIAKHTVKVLSNGIFYSFNVVNKYRLSKSERAEIFSRIEADCFSITFTTKTHTYYK